MHANTWVYGTSESDQHYHICNGQLAYLSSEHGSQGILDFLGLLQQGVDLESAFELRFAIPFDDFQYQWGSHLKKNVSWFTYLSIHLYEILFVSAALLTIWGFVRKTLRRRAYSVQEDEEDLS